MNVYITGVIIKITMVQNTVTASYVAGGSRVEAIINFCRGPVGSLR
jgi:hypothetical protein